MRKIFYFIMLLFGITVANTACDDWTDMEPKFQEDMTQSSLPEEYYAQLRAYKKQIIRLLLDGLVIGQEMELP